MYPVRIYTVSFWSKVKYSDLRVYPMVETLLLQGAAQSLFNLLPVIILIAIVIIILNTADGSMSGSTSPAARRGFLKGIIGLGVIGFIVAYIFPLISETVSDTQFTIGILDIDSGETFQATGEKTYTGVDIEDSGTLSMVEGSQLNIRE